MQKKELKQMEKLLLARKKVLLREVEERFKKYQDANTGKPTDIAEMASSASDGDLEILVAEGDTKELKQIEDALSRIRAGHYGSCEQCGRPIKKARLKAIPFTTLCISCKEEEEKVCNDKDSQAKYDWENTVDSQERNETKEMDKKYLGSKLVEFESDDNRN